MPPIGNNPPPKNTKFPEGTKIRTRLGDAVHEYKLEGDKFKNTKTGKVVSYNELFPNDVDLDVNNDGKYNQKDFDIWKKMGREKTAQNLSKSVSSSSSRGILGFSEYKASELVDFEGNDLQFSAFKRNEKGDYLFDEDFSFGKQYKIILPGN